MRKHREHEQNTRTSAAEITKVPMKIETSENNGKGNERETILPLEFLQEFKRKYPDAFDEINILRLAKDCGDSQDWPEWCFIQVGATLAYSFKTDPSNYMEVGPQLAALSPWRIGKQVFNLDPDLEAALSEQEIEEIPFDVFMHLPFYAFYVKCNDLKIDGKDYDGFFVHLDHDFINSSTDLRALLLANDLSTSPVAIHIDCHTLKGSIDRDISIFEQYCQCRQIPFVKFEDFPCFDVIIALQTKILNIVLYICSKNADMRPRSSQAVTRSWDTGTRKIRDRYGEVRQWDVGVRHGNMFRRQNSISPAAVTYSSVGQRRSPRPHLRRGHFHHYLVGSRNVPADERQYIIKWIAPTFIGDYNDQNDPVVLQVVS